MSGKLYLVGTPIGNLGDMSPRAVEALQNADFIAAEDTRVTLKLLNHFDIRKPLTSYYEHNKFASGEKIFTRILSGETCALVTDAGMPAISDPGEDIVRLCAENGVEVYTVPGPSALISALALSALPTGRFTFEGFLSVSSKSRREHLAQLKTEQRTMIFYEAPHKLQKTLSDLAEAFGGDRPIALCRELTKMHEETLRTTISGAIEHFSATAPKGEFVLVVGGYAPADEPETSPEDAMALVANFRGEGYSLREACKMASAETGFSKNELYDMALRENK